MKPLLLFFCFLISGFAFGQKNISVYSPNHQLTFIFTIDDSKPVYSIRYKHRVLIENSSLSLHFSDDAFAKTIRSGKPVFKDTTEDYHLLTGKTSHVTTHYHEALIPLTESSGRHINIRVKVFDDGIAFRYEFPQQAGWLSYTLLDENTTFNLTGDPVVHTLMFGTYTSSHEGIYQTLPLSKVVPDTLLDMPALFEFPGGVNMAITEAALRNYAGMYLSKQNGILVSKLSPLPGQKEIKVKADLPHKTPWRVMLISDKIGDLIESNIITTLNEASPFKDWQWLKPGTTTFPWWNGNVLPDTINAPGNNFITNQYYIDFCARNGIQSHSVVEYGLHQWYTDDGEGFQPGPHADVTKPVPDLDMKAVCDYARSKGVDVRVWVHFYALYPKLDTAFAMFEKWGLSGMMVDFMDRDDQLMVNMQEEILQKAAQHHLHVQFHGAFKPTGLSRTYPNELTREATRNYEVNKWDNGGISPDHDITMPFTRGLAGATDYHLGGFRAVPQSKFRAQYTRPLVLGTRCHMLAMYVVLETNLGMVCDYPEAYEGQKGFEFLKEVPTTWDETKVLDAKVNKYITIARRKGTDWYVGTITNHEARDVQIPLSFLQNGNYTVTIYSDADDTDVEPNHLNKQQREVTGRDVIPLHIAGGGGEVMKLTLKP